MTCFAADFANPPTRPLPTWAHHHHHQRLLKIDRYQRILKRRKSSQGLEQLLRVSSWDGFSWMCRQEKDAQVLVKVASYGKNWHLELIQQIIFARRPVVRCISKCPPRDLWPRGTHTYRCLMGFKEWLWVNQSLLRSRWSCVPAQAFLIFLGINLVRKCRLF